MFFMISILAGECPRNLRCARTLQECAGASPCCKRHHICLNLEEGSELLSFVEASSSLAAGWCWLCITVSLGYLMFLKKTNMFSVSASCCVWFLVLDSDCLCKYMSPGNEHDQSLTYISVSYLA